MRNTEIFYVDLIPTILLKELEAAIQREEITYFCRGFLHSTTQEGVRLRSSAFNYFIVQ